LVLKVQIKMCHIQILPSKKKILIKELEVLSFYLTKCQENKTELNIQNVNIFKGNVLEQDLQYMPWEYHIQEQYHLTFLKQIKPYS
jgi:hypothetical protein